MHERDLAKEKHPQNNNTVIKNLLPNESFPKQQKISNIRQSAEFFFGIGLG